MKQSIAEGKHWYIALLEAIALWTPTEEVYQGRQYQYLIAEEAFDWQLLAERLCYEIEGLVPEKERMELLAGNAPMDFSKEEFRALIGHEKYQAHLNYFYGITVEQALQLAVEMEIEKEHLQINLRNIDHTETAFHRIYGASETVLLKRFENEKKYDLGNSISLTMFNEFTYWLFKYRLANCDSSRVASDTNKALGLLEGLNTK